MMCSAIVPLIYFFLFFPFSLSSCNKFEDSMLKRKWKVLSACKYLVGDYTQMSLILLVSSTEFSEINCRILF